MKKLYEDGKQSLETLLRERAYTEVKEQLDKKSINIEDVNDEDIEILVSERVKDMKNGIKGFSIGTAVAIAFSLLTGI